MYAWIFNVKEYVWRSRKTSEDREHPEELRNRKEMHIRSQQLGSRGVSMDMKTSWAAQEYDSTFPNLETRVLISKAQHEFKK